MEENLGLNEHHHQQAISFVRFSRYKRNQSLKGVEQCFQDLEDSKLYDDTYTVDEVKEMFEELLKAVHNEIDMEMLNSSHTSALLLKQLLIQAQKWHLKLTCDVSELENRELLEQIAAFEERALNLTSNSAGVDKNRLKPIDSGSGADLLHQEIERLQAENKNLLAVVKKQEQAVSSCEEKNRSLLKQINDGTANNKQTSNANDLEEEIKRLRIELKSKKETSADGSLLDELTSTKHELLKTKHQLETANEELEMKFNQTTAYKNLKEMLSKKNDQIKTLRKTLEKYESVE